MQKMFTTQLMGLFKRISDKEELMIEDAARLLAQAPVGDGHIYIKGFQEMLGVELEALYGEEPIQSARPFEKLEDLTHVDRLLLITRHSGDKEALELADKLREMNIPFVAISSNRNEEGIQLSDLADVHLHTQLLKPLLPKEDGGRVGFPSLIAASYLFHCIKFILDEIMEDYL